ncbi:MAG TPA: molecular chaperone DnaJ [Aggregatilineales bacterium]|nr:molecular chaperone DnaJ [Anaerolineales bacterium]HRE47554.1 molecular chaperone DnaJ [Aggregatilineales bacterium]
MMPKDLYDILGVAKNASTDDLKRAYRKLAKQYHPDTNKEDGAEETFKEVNAAYAILSDADKRARYDRYGYAGIDPNAGAGGFSGGFGGYTDLSEMFEELFGAFTGNSRRSAGGAAGRKQPRAGRDLRLDMTLTFEESIFGITREVDVSRLEKCEVCSGNGAEPGTAVKRCPDCGGTGEVKTVRQTFLGSMVSVAGCSRCNGTGEMIESPCKTCRGEGKTRKTRKVTVTVPPGVDDTTRLRVAGEGDSGDNGGPNGNVMVFFRVQKHDYFKRRDNDILLELQVNIAQAALGADVSVPTVDGMEMLTIPAGTQSGKTFVLRGHGAPRLRGDGTSAGRGDQIIVVEVVIPTKLTPEQRGLFEELGRSLGTEVHPARANKGFFERVAEFFNGGDPRS